MSNELNLSRQTKLVPKEATERNIKIFGVGSVGSHVARILAKTGFTNISVYDMDIVEEENIAAQAFNFGHLKMNKVDAIKNLIEEETGIQIEAHHGQINAQSVIEPEPNTVYCCFFDSFEGRKLVFDMLKDYPVTFVDGRIGAFDMRHYLVDCSNAEYVKEFEQTLAPGAVSELACGEKASAPINNMISGMIAMNIINYLKGGDYSRKYIANAAATTGIINVLESRGK